MQQLNLLARYCLLWGSYIVDSFLVLSYDNNLHSFCQSTYSSCAFDRPTSLHVFFLAVDSSPSRPGFFFASSTINGPGLA